MHYTIKEERLTAEEYIEFLKHTDLGSQYPKERFRERIGTLVNRASISLVARNDAESIVGVCFGITDLIFIALRFKTGANCCNIGEKTQDFRTNKRTYR